MCHAYNDKVELDKERNKENYEVKKEPESLEKRKKTKYLWIL